MQCNCMNDFMIEGVCLQEQIAQRYAPLPPLPSDNPVIPMKSVIFSLFSQVLVSDRFSQGWLVMQTALTIDMTFNTAVILPSLSGFIVLCGFVPFCLPGTFY